MSEQNEITGHDYDGIKECDNPLPNWWLWTFYVTVFFAFGYFFYYELGKGPSLKQELAVQMEEYTALKKANAPKVSEDTEEALAALMNPETVKAGAAIFAGKCASCHGEQLQGLIGPNLTDNYWIHGGKRVDMIKVITTGVADKGMPPWGELLKKEEMVQVISFIISKNGSNPPNPKAPQGDLVQDQPAQ